MPDDEEVFCGAPAATVAAGPASEDPLALGDPAVAVAVLRVDPDAAAEGEPEVGPLELEVPGEPADDVPAHAGLLCAAAEPGDEVDPPEAGFDTPEDPRTGAFDVVEGAGVERGEADAVGFGAGLLVLPELTAGGLIPGCAPAPKLKPTAEPGAGSQLATPDWL